MSRPSAQAEVRTSYLTWAIAPLAAVTAAYFTILVPKFRLFPLAALSLIPIISTPALTLVAVVVGVEEETASANSGQASRLVSVGSQALYFASFKGVTAVTALVVLTAAASKRHAPGVDRSLAWIIGILLGYCFVLLAVQDVAWSKTILATRNFALLFLAGIVGRAAVRQPDWRRTFPALVACLLTYKAVAGLAASARGEVVGGSSLLRLVYYDSALALFVVACVIGAQVARPHSKRLHAVITVAALAVLVCALRRNVLAGGLLVLVLLPAISRQWQRLARMYAGAALVACGALVFARPLVMNLYASVNAALLTITGTGRVDTSTAGHADDIHRAWDYAREAGVWGVGYLHDQLPGLVVSQGQIYVHNEFLHDWLRLGLPASVLVAIIVTLGMVRSIRRLHQGNLNFMEAVAAVFLLMLPVTLWFFPNVSVNQRWPILIGFCLGVLSPTGASAVSSKGSLSRVTEPNGNSHKPVRGAAMEGRLLSGAFAPPPPHHATKSPTA